MNATDLKVFEAVARHGSINRVAAELNTVQSNVTGRVRASSSLVSFYFSGMHAA
jgi:LysR family transcriptional regulator, cell division regulator